MSCCFRRRRPPSVDGTPPPPNSSQTPSPAGAHQKYAPPSAAPSPSPFHDNVKPDAPPPPPPEVRKSSRRDLKRNTSRAATGGGETAASNGAAHLRPPNDLHSNATDNNGLSRGQNFMKIEKWLRDSAAASPLIIIPGDIVCIPDELPTAIAPPTTVAVDPPTESDRLPPMMPVAQSQLTLQS